MTAHAPATLNDKVAPVVKSVNDHIREPVDGQFFSFNKWFKNRYIDVYVLQSQRYDIKRKMRVHTLEINNVEVRYKNKGYFRAFLAQMEALADSQGLTLFVGQLLSYDLEHALIRRGYTLYNANEWPYSYWRLLDCSSK